MVKIRLMRMGAKKRPFFRVVVADSRSPRDGRFIENIGKYHPLEDPSLIEIDGERALHWLKQGAQPTEAVTVLLRIQGIWEQFTGEPAPAAKPARPPRPSKKKQKAAAAPPPPPAAAAADAPAAEEPAPAPEEAPVAEEPAPAPEEAPAEGEAEGEGS